jgi:predicted DNA-binding ribbon-helix-helix protein
MSTELLQEKPMKSPVVKRSIVIAGHKTSVSLEDAFWTGLKEIAAKRDLTLSDMVATIDQDRRHGNLSSAIRLFVLDYYRGGGHAGAHTDTKPASINPGMGRSEQIVRAE